jgi:hypothetical protein
MSPGSLGVGGICVWVTGALLKGPSQHTGAAFLLALFFVPCGPNQSNLDCSRIGPVRLPKRSSINLRSRRRCWQLAPR